MSSKEIKAKIILLISRFATLENKDIDKFMRWLS